VIELLPPLPATLEKYGLTLESWRQLAERQGSVCAICRRLPSSGRLNVDHIHVRGFKKMPAGKKALYVRGLLCFFCNKLYCGRGITIEKSKAVTAYLQQPLPFNVARAA
jgi:recombination endonuclease VII